MIEPTEEMERAMIYGGRTRDRLRAVLAIVERDYCLEAKGHVWHPLAKDRPSPRCGARGFAGPDPGCVRRAGHEGRHGYSDGSGEQDAP